MSVCLVCFNGGCDAHARDHYLKKQHPLVLKFNRTIVQVTTFFPNPVQNEFRGHQKEVPEEKKKITKLAIGKEGGADYTGEEYVTSTKLFCLACNIELDPTPVNPFICETNSQRIYRSLAL